MLFREIIAVYCESRKEYGNTPREYNAKYFYVNVDGTNSYHCALNGQRVSTPLKFSFRIIIFRSRAVSNEVSINNNTWFLRDRSAMES
jgi:hypothetical protein